MDELVFDADERDLPVVEMMVQRSLEAPEVPDVIQMRLTNNARLASPLVRRPVAGTVVKPVMFGATAGEWLDVPLGSDRVTVMYCHGGAYVRGTLVQGRPMASAMASALGGRAAAIAYSQAPEHPFPDAIADAVNAYRHLLESGVESGSLILAGDSAGGSIIVSALVQVRDKGWPLPKACISLSPWADLSLSGPSWQFNAGRDIAQWSFCKVLADLYLNGADPRDPLASPVFADLSGLPPMLVVVGERESLYSDARALADRVGQCGGEVQLHTYRGMTHAFPMFCFNTSDAVFTRVAEFVSSVQRVV